MSIFSLFEGKLQKDATLVASSPQSLSSLTDENSEHEFLIKKSKSFEDVEFKIDYSDFANFVFFNSAEDYFNISGERILNEYPYDGTVENIQDFSDDSDPYQKWLFSRWPKSSGHLRFFQPSGSFVKFTDSGKENGAAKTAILSPNTGSLTIEAWYRPSSASLASSNTVQFLFQKTTGNGSGYSLFLSSSFIYFDVTSGSFTTQVSASVSDNEDKYVACVLDRSAATGSLFMYTGSMTSFPALATSASVNFYSSLDLGTSSFYIGSGTLTGKETALYTGSIGEIRIWKKIKQLSDLSSSFNYKTYAQSGLVGLWNFSETGSVNSTKELVYDRSGHKLDGRIQGYYAGLRSSGSVVAGTSEPILAIEAPEIHSLILTQQTSASLFDKNNNGIITRLFPESFFFEEEAAGTDIFKNFLFVAARLFDQIKVAADQFAKIYTVNYTAYDQAPDALLADVANFYGWDFTGNFISADAFQYLVGKGVLGNLDANYDLDTKLYDIKNELWRRTLNNLSYIYKTKGTRESAEALLRSYGVRNNLFRIKEYSLNTSEGLSPQRIQTDKSVDVAVFGSSSLTASLYQTVPAAAQYLSGADHTFEMRVMFPLTSSVDIPATISSGTLWTYAGDQNSYYSLVYQKDSYSSRTGSLFLTSSAGLLGQLTGVGIFDGEWQNVSVAYSYVTGAVEISVRNAEFGEIKNTARSSSAAVGLRDLMTSSLLNKTIVGSSQIAFGTAFDTWRFAQYKAQEFRVWKLKLSDSELIDHTLNYQSYGLQRPRTNLDGNLLEHWRLDYDNVTIASTASNGDQFTAYDIAGIPSIAYVTGANFSSTGSPNGKVLNDYSYIAAPEMGWTDDKIRIINSSKQKKNEVASDSSIIAIEFNLVDSLNEDISQMMSSFDELNSILGVGAAKYHEAYAGLSHLRQQYFRRLQGRLNFRLFADMLEFFDRSFLTMVKRLIPARATFLGDEFVVESHSLERPKFQYGHYLKQEIAHVIEGTINLYGPSGFRFTKSSKDVVTVSSNARDNSGIVGHTKIGVPKSVK